MFLELGFSQDWGEIFSHCPEVGLQGIHGDALRVMNI